MVDRLINDRDTGIRARDIRREQTSSFFSFSSFFFSFLPLIVRGETIYRFDLFSDSFGMTEMEFAIVYVI